MFTVMTCAEAAAANVVPDPLGLPQECVDQNMYKCRNTDNGYECYY